MPKETYVFDPRPHYPFLFTVNRYPGTAEDGATLILTHGTGFHKEIWEPVIERLYDLERREGGFKIREAWSVECPNHGDSAILNEEKLSSGVHDNVFSWEEYGRSVHSMLAGLGTLKMELHDGTLQQVNIDFTKRKLVALGHSMGSISLILSQTFYPLIPFDFFILIEPVLIPIPLDRKYGLNDLAGAAAARRDVWPSRQSAWDAFNSRRSWKMWDERILKLYVEYALRDIPASDPAGRKGVTLKCSKAQEVATYGDFVGRHRGYDFLGHLCSQTPVHLIWGGNSAIKPEMREVIENVAAGGKLASVQTLPGLHHLAPQMDPTGVADVVWATFVRNASKAKL